jgi:hypothetical protein
MKTISHLISTVFFTGLYFVTAEMQAQFPDEDHSNLKEGAYYSDRSGFPNNNKKTVNPFIASCLDQVNSDSIRSIIQHMQDYGTRFMLHENRKEIAEWIKNKMISYGYTEGEVQIDSFLNIVNWNNIYIDTTWQYNIVCTLQGSSAPGEEYIIGGHYDSYKNQDPYAAAPGADDNASAVAASLEIARVMKSVNYVPEATIKIIFFAAEELGLFGSRYQAQKARMDGDDIRFVLNMDMIANNPDNVKEVKIFRYLFCEWAADLAADIIERYTDLKIFFPANMNSSGSDSYSYWINRFPPVYFEERNFSPNWHQPSDTIGNCNIPYCAEITKGALAIILEQQFLPYPQGVSTRSSRDDVVVSWIPTTNMHVAGFNLYRSEESGSSYTKINPALITDDYYSDKSVPAGRQYYYVVTLVNDSMQESLASPEVWGARFAFTDTLLVVNVLKNNETTPDSIVNFYNDILDTIPFAWYDLNDQNPLDLNTLSRFRNILLTINSFNTGHANINQLMNLATFLDNGGNLMFTGFRPSVYFDDISAYPSRVNEGGFMNTFFKLDSVNLKINSFLFRAYPDKPGYDTVWIDPAKTLVPGYAGEIYNVEVFTPKVDGRVIYRFDSHYDQNTAYGFMKNKPVGVEYMGEDFKSILLSFPLYYLDTLAAKELVAYVLKNKFIYPTGMYQQRGPVMTASLNIFPNPAADKSTIELTLTRTSHVHLTLYTLLGRPVITLADEEKSPGHYSILQDLSMLSPGIYIYRLTTDFVGITRKIVIY